MEFEFCKLEIFLPESHLEAVQQALWSVDAGHIGRYDCCLSYSPVIGAWRPLAGTAPYLGRMGEVCHAPELKVEVTCRTDRVEETVAAVKRAHPYEEPAYSILQNHALHRQEVYGMVGELPRPMRPEELATMSETALNTRIQYVPTGREILTVAVCGGAGSDFMGEALAAGAEAFLTGEVKHHEWFMAAEQGLCLMAAGHHATEHPAMPQLAKQLRAALPGLPVEVFDSNPARWGGI